MTATLETPKQDRVQPSPVRLHRFTLEAFDRMIKAGIVDNESRVELLDGFLVEMEPVNIPHMNRVKDIYDRLHKAFADRADVYGQSSIELPQDGRPQPDVALIQLGVARERFAQPEHVLLVIEVADSSIEKDRGFKLSLYARDGITEYWIVNLVDNQLEVYRDPQGERYATSFTLKAGTLATCLAFPDEPIDWS